jgi:endothelin-converting enzyme
MNEDAIKQEGAKPLLKLLESIVTTFPATPSSARGGEDISDAIDLLARLGVSALIALGTGADDKDPDVVVVQVAAPYTIGLPAKDYYTDESVLRSYEATLADVLEALNRESSFGSDASSIKFDQIRKSAHDVIEFEKKLAAASPNAEDRDAVDVSRLPDQK